MDVTKKSPMNVDDLRRGTQPPTPRTAKANDAASGTLDAYAFNVACIGCSPLRVRLPDRHEYTKTPGTACYASQKLSHPWVSHNHKDPTVSVTARMGHRQTGHGSLPHGNRRRGRPRRRPAPPRCDVGDRARDRQIPGQR